VSAVSVAAMLPGERVEGKVQPWHRDRLAVVRQSTAAQVQDHAESTRLQYGLAGRAAALGWAPSRVLVIDKDLGHSASGPMSARASPGWSPRWGWIMWASCWASRCPGWPGRAGSGISCWVRHEALCIRVEMEGLHRRAVAAVW